MNTLGARILQSAKPQRNFQPVTIRHFLKSLLPPSQIKPSAGSHKLGRRAYWYKWHAAKLRAKTNATLDPDGSYQHDR